MAFALLDHTEEKATIDEILTGTFREKDRQINFAIEELEKIRQESARLTEKNIMATGTRADGRIDIIEIIDKHISELKERKQ